MELKEAQTLFTVVPLGVILGQFTKAGSVYKNFTYCKACICLLHREKKDTERGKEGALIA